MTTTEQQILLLHQIQSGHMSAFNALLIGILLKFPLPESIFPLQARLNLFNTLIAANVVPHTSNPLMFLTLVVFWPLWFMLGLTCLYFLTKGLFAFVRIVAPSVLSKFTRREPKIFLELTFPADTSKTAYATEQLYVLMHTLSRQYGFWDTLTQHKNEYSLELVSTRKEGIRYILATDPKYTEILEHDLLSYLPGIKVGEVKDYLPAYIDNKSKNERVGLVELKLKAHFALPLETQRVLSEHDPISYLTGNMTKLDLNELIAIQVVVTPVVEGIHRNVLTEMKNLRYRMYKGKPLTEALQKNIFQQFVELPGISLVWLVLRGLWKVFSFVVMFIFSMAVGFWDTSGKSVPFLQLPTIVIPQDILNPYERELSEVVKGKIDQPLFETSIRILVAMENPESQHLRLNGILASFGQMSSSYQALGIKHSLFPWFDQKLKHFSDRTLSHNIGLNHNPILSTSELSDLYHFPYTDTTKTEDMVKVHSKELSAPLSLKNNNNLDVIFGKNTYGGTETNIGLTDDDRSRHVYMIGQTGSGKSTVIYHMAKGDIEKGRGVAVIDPHGDLADALLTCIPKSRINDCIYVNPFDLKYPIGINLLELTPNLDDDELELEKELVCESVISTLRRIFTKDENVDAHRIEYILRNTIYTAFTVKDSTLFTVYDLLNNPDFQKKVTKDLDDENLKNFWKNEFGRAGNYQIVKMVSGVTARIGRFLFSPTAKRMLEQPKSTINFDDILSSEKILICNVGEGHLGEDTSQLLGTMMIAKIQQAAMRRARQKLSDRTPFYLFIDEFQNYATTSFTKLLSGGRKFGLRLTIAEQSTAQQEDRNVVNVILANTGTVLCFRSAGPVDEDLMARQFRPEVTDRDIVNLPRYHFYIKLSAVEPEEPFSGETLPMNENKNPNRKQQVIEASRKNWAIVYKKPKTVKPIVTPKTKGEKNVKSMPKTEKDVDTLV